MNVLDALEAINNAIDDFDQAMRKETSFTGSAVNLDTRCYGIYVVNDDMIVVNKSDDRSLQYYGGFEYVNKDFRQEVGDWVIYHQDDERVRNCIDYFEEEYKAA